MPRRLPAWLHRLALIVAHRGRLLWWRLAPRDLHGCAAIVSDSAGAVLLVRHSYQTRQAWMLPGGGIDGRESAEAAAVREVCEETGCRLTDACSFAIECVPLAGCRNFVHLVAGATADRPRADGREIVAARFFAADALPDTVAPPTRRRIERWQAWRAAQRRLA